MCDVGYGVSEDTTNENGARVLSGLAHRSDVTGYSKYSNLTDGEGDWV